MAVALRSWTIRLDASTGWPPSMNSRLHYAAYAKITAAWRSAAYAEIMNAAGIRPLRSARVQIAFHSARGRYMDPDGLVARAKVLYDALVGCYVGKKPHRVFLSGILKDDSAQYLDRVWPTEVRDGGQWIEMTIEELPAADYLTSVGHAGRPE